MFGVENRYEICDLFAFGGDYLIKIEKEIELNGEELAREFWEQDCEQQAEFFNQNKFITNEWNHGRAILQIDWLVEYLDNNGRDFIRRIYDSMQEYDNREEIKEQILEDAAEIEADYDVDTSDSIMNCSTCKNNVEFPPPHTCDICTSLDQDEEYGMWEAKE